MNKYTEISENSVCKTQTKMPQILKFLKFWCVKHKQNDHKLPKILKILFVKHKQNETKIVRRLAEKNSK